MLTIRGRSWGSCDGVTRRRFLTVGAFGLTWAGGAVRTGATWAAAAPATSTLVISNARKLRAMEPNLFI